VLFRSVFAVPCRAAVPVAEDREAVVHEQDIARVVRIAIMDFRGVAEVAVPALDVAAAHRVVELGLECRAGARRAVVVRRGRLEAVRRECWGASDAADEDGGQKTSGRFAVHGSFSLMV